MAVVKCLNSTGSVVGDLSLLRHGKEEWLAYNLVLYYLFPLTGFHVSSLTLQWEAQFLVARFKSYWWPSTDQAIIIYSIVSFEWLSVPICCLWQYKLCNFMISIPYSDVYQCKHHIQTIYIFHSNKMLNCRTVVVCSIVYNQKESQNILGRAYFMWVKFLHIWLVVLTSFVSLKLVLLLNYLWN